MNYSFSAIMPTSTGLLSPDDLHLFYYDIAIDSLTGSSIMYEWNEDIDSFIEQRHLTIEECKEKFPTEFESDKMYFSIDETNLDESKAMAFFRHLRNAFAHYHINRYGDYFYMKDIHKTTKKQKLSMIGKIKSEDLKDLCFLFIKQGEKYETTNLTEP